MAFETFAVHAACIRGVEAIPVTVEVSLAGGVPGIQMLGIPSMEVMESRGRIRCAMRSAGFEIPRSGITVNLAPGDIRKTGSGFDLPIAIACWQPMGRFPATTSIAALSLVSWLDGTVLPVKGEVAFQLLARDMGLSFIAGRSTSMCHCGRGLRIYRSSVSACSWYGRCRAARLGFRGRRGDL
ncbi:MAG: magnesium chelatase domain-containing protein [Collinsella sp.]